MTTVWMIQTHEGHGEDADVMGVYASEDAARAALEAQPNMEVGVRHDPFAPEPRLGGWPVDERNYPHLWAMVVPMEVQG